MHHFQVLLSNTIAGKIWRQPRDHGLFKLMFTSVHLLSLEVSIKPEGVVCGPRHNSHALVLSHSLLKEVGLSLQGNVLHEVKWILYSIDLKKGHN